MNQGGRKWGKSQGSSAKEVEVRCEERRPCCKLGAEDGSAIRMDSEGLHQRKWTVEGMKYTTELHAGMVKH